jgi:Xaa-Pro aminopeptidase
MDAILSRGTFGGMADQTTGQAHDPDYPEKLLAFMRTSWRDTPLDLRPVEAADRFAARRAALSAAYPGVNLVIPSGRECVRSNDSFYPFRPGSDLVWLTGEHDPDAVLVMRPATAGDAGHAPSHDATLFIWPRSPRDTDEFFRDRVYGEFWIGRRHTLAEKSAELGIATAPLDSLGDVLADLAPGRTRTLRGLDPVIDRQVLPVDDRDAALASVLDEMRLTKDAWEIAQLQDAVDATVRGFEDVARVLPADRPVAERLVDGVFGLRARHDGNGVGYSAIVGAGPHSTTLHWIRNDGYTAPGELLLMDMGVENRHLYTADVTRTVPVSGAFTSLQREVYDIVYASQQAGIDLIKPGVEFTAIHETCMRVLAAGLADLGLLPESVDEAMSPDSQVYRRWTLHGFGHMLGLDVHDCAQAPKETYRQGTVRDGYVLTVEPGLYFQTEDDLVPEELRGIGVRIEDDVLVTDAGAVVLSAGLPRAAADVERWLAAQREAGPRLPG